MKNTLFHDRYQLLHQAIGSGSTSKVYKAVDRQNETVVAVKIIQNSKQYANQEQILTTLNHPHIIKMVGSYRVESKNYICLEFCNGDDLFAKIKKQGYCGQAETKIMFRAMTEAVAHCHAKHVCHRDLKPQNFVFADKHDLTSLRLIDFGFAKVCKTRLKPKVGTIYYLSPQMLQGSYDLGTDIWSLGVILYVMLTGMPPFNGDSDERIKENIKNRKYDLNVYALNKVSNEAKDLISKCLCPSLMRLTAGEILQHKWLKPNYTLKLEDENRGPLEQYSINRN